MSFFKIYSLLKKLQTSIKCGISRKHFSVAENTLFFDISGIAMYDRRTGIQRVVRELLTYLNERGFKDIKLVPVYAPRFTKGFYCIELKTDSSHKIIDINLTTERISPKAGDSLFIMDWALGEHLCQINVLRDYKRLGVRLFYVIHDLLPLERPDCFNNRTVYLFRRLFERLWGLTDFVCFSIVTQKKLERLKETHHFNSKIYKIRLGTWTQPNNFIEKELPESLRREEPDQCIFLMVGTIEPRKNQQYVLREFERLWEKGSKDRLIIIGKPGWKCKEIIRELTLKSASLKHFYYFPSISDQSLVNYYSMSSALVYASTDEGYGLPLIEAAAIGIPLICCEKPIFREILDENAFFYSLGIGNLERAVEEWRKLPRDKIPDSRKVALYSWEDMAKDLLALVL